MKNKGPDDEVTIDEGRLDLEFLDQPQKVLKYAERQAQARYDLDLSEREFDLLQAQLSLEVRNTPSEFGLDAKPTVDAVKATIVVQKPYQEAAERVNRAKYHLGVVAGVCNALEHRKRALEGLVQLHLAGYHSEPRTPKGSEFNGKVNDARKSRVREPMKTRKRKP